ncbi:serine hydrolase domain-containing protein [Candidatus Poribacteria bacterium]
MRGFRFLACHVLLIAGLLCRVSTGLGAVSEPELPFAQELQNVLDSARQTTNVMGVSAAIIVPGYKTWLGVSGMSHPGAPITTDMLFDMGSAGKNLFAALVLKLAEADLLSLDDPISKYLSPHPNVDGSITIRQCLNHTSGLFMWVEHPQAPTRIPYNSINFEKWWTPDEIFTTLGGEPYFPPGEGWHYTQAGFILGTLIVEKVTGSTTSTEIQKRLLDPLDIHGMLLDLREPIPAQHKIAHNWVDTDGDGTCEDVSSRSRNWINSLARILFYTTAEDFARWGHALFQGQVLSQASLDEMLDFHSPTPGEPRLSGYGLGTCDFTQLLGGVRAWGHDGSTPGYRAFMAYLPDYGVTFSGLMNDDSDEDGRYIVGVFVNALRSHLPLK